MDSNQPDQSQVSLPLKRVAIIGAGLMGHGIAQVFAEAGMVVHVYDKVSENLKTLHDRIQENLSALGRGHECLGLVHACTSIQDAVSKADIIFEAVAEDIEIKSKLFSELENYVSPEVIFASNTSVIPITKIMETLEHKNRALGTHWWNPPFLIPLVEVVPTSWTDPEVTERVMRLMVHVGKQPVKLARDVTGFIGNRLQNALWREAVAVVEEGICSAEDVDLVVKASFGRRLSVLGPLENADLIGTDLTLAIQKIVFPEINSRPAPSPYLENLVQSGRLGMKTGEGFRRWSAEEQSVLRKKFFDALVKQQTAPDSK